MSIGDEDPDLRVHTDDFISHLVDTVHINVPQGWGKSFIYCSSLRSVALPQIDQFSPLTIPPPFFETLDNEALTNAED